MLEREVAGHKLLITDASLGKCVHCELQVYLGGEHLVRIDESTFFHESCAVKFIRRALKEG